MVKSTLSFNGRSNQEAESKWGRCCGDQSGFRVGPKRRIRYYFAASAPNTYHSSMLLFRKVSILICLAALAALAGYLYLQTKVDSAVTKKISILLNQQLNSIGLSATLDGAQFVEDQGLQLTDLRVVDPTNGKSPILEVYKAFVHMPVSLTELITLPPQPQGLELKRAKLRIVRYADGRFNIQPLIQFLQQTKPSTDIIPVRLVDSTIEFEDRLTNQFYSLENVSLVLEPTHIKSRSVAKMTVSFNGEFIDDFDGTVYLDPTNGEWIADLNRLQVDLSQQLLAALPSSVTSILPVSNIDGQIRLAGRVYGEADILRQMPKFDLRGTVRDLNINSDQLPVGIQSVNASFAINQDGFSVTQATGNLDQGKFELSYRQTGLLERSDWSLSGQCRHVNFRPQMLSVFPDYCVKFCHEYSPEGLFDLQFELDSKGHKLIHADLIKMSFDYCRFPYKLEGCSGQVDWRGELCNFEVTSQNGKQRINLVGHVKNPGPLATYRCDIATLGDFPIDEKLMKAVDAFPKMSSTVRAFNATGRVSCQGRIEKHNPKHPIANKNFNIQLSDCTTRHTHFNYLVHHVAGSIQMRNSDFHFENVTGSNNTSRVTCNGVWNESEGLNLRFICNDVKLDTQLRTALPENIQEIWDGFRPSGTVALTRVDLLMPPGATEVDVRLDARLATEVDSSSHETVTIEPTWFPYELNQMTGRIRIGQGELNLEKIRGRHGRAWLSTNGYGQYDHERWAVRLYDILAGALPVDDDLISALPETLAQSIRQLKYKGLVTVNGETTLSGQHSGYAPAEFAQVSHPASSSEIDPNFKMSWDVRFDMEQAEVLLGLPIQNVFGQLSLKGQYFGEKTKCKGEIALDSLTLYGIQITNLTGPFWIDDSKVLAGVYTSQIVPTDQHRSLVGNVFGGQIRFDSHLRYAEDIPFRIDVTLANSKLQDVAAEVAPQFRDMNGKGFASFQMTGNCVDWNSLYGLGTVQLRDAEIYQLPVILSLLKILRVKEVTTSAFDTSNINFKLQGDRIDLQRIELIGDAISLIGNGKLNMNRDIDLNFYSVVGRNDYIPLLSEIVELGAQQIMWINIRGQLDNPQTHQNFLPYLNESIKQLFQTPTPNSFPSTPINSQSGGR